MATGEAVPDQGGAELNFRERGRDITRTVSGFRNRRRRLAASRLLVEQ